MSEYASLLGVALDATGQPIAGLTLELLRLSVPPLTLERVTAGEDGRFQFNVDFGSLPPGSTFEVRAHEGARRLEITSGQDAFSGDARPDFLFLEVERYVPMSRRYNPPPDPPSDPYSVSGRVIHRDGTALAGLTVKAFRHVDSAWDEIGTFGPTGTDGAFSIGFASLAGSLQVRAYDGAEQIAATRGTRPRGAHHQQDVVVTDSAYRRLSEFEWLEAHAPGEIGTSEWSDLDEEGRELLAQQLSVELAMVHAYVDAKVLKEELDELDALTDLAEVLYALHRQGVDADIDRMDRMPVGRLAGLLEAAADSNQVTAAIKTNSEACADDVIGFRITRALQDKGPEQYGALLDQTSISASSDKENFVRQLLEHQGPMKDFWQELDGFTSGERDELRRMYEVGRISLGNAELLEAINLVDDTKTIQDIAAFSYADWQVVLAEEVSTASPPAIPAEIPGADLSERTENYIKHLQQAGERAYPHAFLRARILDSEGRTAGDPLFDYLAATPLHSFDERVTEVMTSHPGALEELKEYRRLYHLAPQVERHEVITELRNKGFSSAWQVQNLTQAQLIEQLGVEGEVAARVHQRATRQHSANTSLYLLIRGDQANPVQMIPGSRPEDYQDDPSFQEIFVGPTMCECKHCRSILSPAAYLVDLLEWLRHKLQDDGTTPVLNALWQRRPDIQHLKLSCENTNTTLPYIDLVLEVLENAVEPTPVDAHDVGDATSVELHANPQYVNKAAYDTLRLELHPPSTPFDYYLAQADVFLEHLGVPRPDLMEAFQRSTGGDEPADYEIAGAKLGIGPVAIAALTATFEPETLLTHAYQLWGFDNSAAHTWAAFLAGSAKEIRTRAELSHQEMFDVLAVRFWNPGGAITLSPPTACDPDECTLAGTVGSTELTRLMQIVRLRRALGWSWLEVDKLTHTLGWSSLGVSQLQEAVAVDQLVKETKVELVELLTLFGPLDTRLSHDLAETPVVPLYDRLFLNRVTVANLYVDGASYGPQANPFGLNAGRTELEVSTEMMEDHVPALLAAFGLDETQLRAAMADVASKLEEPVQVEDLPLNMATLSAVYRRALLAKAMGLRVDQVLAIRDLHDPQSDPVEPYDPFASPTETLAFVRRVLRLKVLPGSLDGIRYASNVEDVVAAAAVGPAEEWMRSILGAIRDDVIERTAVSEVPDPNGTQLRALALDLGVEPGHAQTLLGDLELDAESPVAITEAPSSFGPLLPYMDPDVLFGFFDAEDTAPQSTAERYTTILHALEVGLARIEARSIVVRHLASATGLAEEVVETLRSATFDVYEDPNFEGVSDFTDVFVSAGFRTRAGDAGAWDDLQRDGVSAHSDGFDLLEVLVRVSSVLRAYGADAELLSWWVHESQRDEPPSSLGLLNLQELGTDTARTVQEWVATAELVDFRDRLPGDEPPFPELMTTLTDAGLEAFLDALETRTGWPAAAMSVLATDFGMEAASMTPFDLNRLARCAEAAKRCGAEIETVAGWRKAALTAEDADAIVQAARGRHGSEAAWLRVAKDLRDPLRESQRDALVSYLIATSDEIESADDLHSEYLIDSQMAPCMSTSRVVQASGAVQLFIQRVFLGLETGIAFDEEDAADWEWRKSYRVWEAGRKVFLYPENWIEPELRDDKSELFEEFESVLLRDAVTSESASEGVVRFVEDLAKLSSMEVMAVKETANGDVHVFARTRSAPHVYQYRRRDAAGAWYPWQRINLDIQSNHLVAAEIRGHVNLFWLTFTEGEGVSLSWTERAGDGWSGARSQNFVLEDAHLQQDLYAAVPYVEGDGNGVHKADFVLACGTWSTAASSYAHWLVWPFCYLVAEDAVQEIAVEWSSPFDWKFSGGPEVVPLPHPPVGMVRRNNRFVCVSGPLVLNFPNLSLYSGGLNPQPVLNSVPKELVLTLDYDGAEVYGSNYAMHGDGRSYWIRSSGGIFAEVAGVSLSTSAVRVAAFDHPFARDVLAQARAHGAMAILDPREGPFYRQQQTVSGQFAATYAPAPVVVQHPVDAFDFESSAAYGCYNWELFFHIPFLTATRLSGEHRFEEAHRWYSIMFDPLKSGREAGLTPAQRPWKIKPLVDFPSAAVVDWASFAGANTEEAEAQESVAVYETQVAEWLKDPFNPHLLARLRPGTYQRAVVMKYLDNLIAWADDLFSRDTRESLNEATQLYLLAREVLGARPPKVPQRVEMVPLSYAELKDEIDDPLSNPMLQIEDWVDALTSEVHPKFERMTTRPPVPDLSTAFYFCIPGNEEVLGYWDTLDDRLYKLRNCLDIEGRFRQLPLFQPPIDPALLVRARAQGVSISSVLAELQGRRPHHRFSSMMHRVHALLASLKGLGSSLLQALERRDAEELAVLRSTLEIELQRQVRRSRQDQLRSAREGQKAAERGLAEADARWQHFERLLEEGRIEAEVQHVDELKLAHKFNLDSQNLVVQSSQMYMYPDVSAGMNNSSTFGGSNLGAAARAYAEAIATWGIVHSHEANMASIRGSHERREQDWTWQRDQAALQQQTLQRQLLIAEIGVSIAEHELANHDKQVENLRATDQLMRSKFTNQDLYSWMVDQISRIYFQSYQLAMEYARQAQRCYRHELALPDASFIEPGHWDSLKRGLLAGERLQRQVEVMESAYLEHDRREAELIKHFSLKQIDPGALLHLVETGSCYFELSEALFDMDVPGQYLRRLRGVSLTIPGVEGPFVTVNVRLTLQQSFVRSEPKDVDELQPEVGTLESIVTSGRPDDSGLFQFDFSDPKYLPFERRGAISVWRLELTSFANLAYDPRSIQDVVVNVRYTARDGGVGWATTVTAGLQAALNARKEHDGGTATNQELPAVLISARQQYPDAWRKFQQDGTGVLTVPFTSKALPYLHAISGPEVNEIECYLVPEMGVVVEDAHVEDLAHGEAATLSDPEPAPSTTINRDGAVVRVYEDAMPDDIVVTLSSNAPAPADLGDVLLLVRYTLNG